MSSPALTSTSRPSGPQEVPRRPSSPKRRGKIIIIVMATLLLSLICVAAIYWERIWPFTEKAVVEDLAEATDSEVTIRASHRTYFPVPGCVLEGVEFRHGANHWTLITINRLTIEGSYPGIITKHVPRIRAEGGHIFVPPLGSNEIFKTQHSNLIVDELVANGTIVDIDSRDPHKEPLRFDVYHGVVRAMQWGAPISYDLSFHNPEPPGEVTTRGKFGAWLKGKPGETPISGDYAFEHADLGVYGGIAGILSSSGKYAGLLKHIDIDGTTDTPEFAVKSAGHKVRLATRFSAYVDAIHGDTFLKRVDATFGKTHVIAEGSIAGTKESKGKTALINLTSRQGRIEDILGLFDSEPRAPMSGPVSLKAKTEIRPGKAPFLHKVKLDGTFGIDDGTFSKEKTQKDVNELSAGARGEKMQNAEPVLSDLRGQVTLASGVAKFADLTFEIPGTKARMYGTYNLENEKVDLHGRMRVDTKISKTTTGMKSFLMKVMDPFFKKKKKGEVVPVHIGGTYEHPQFGLDLSPPKNQNAPGSSPAPKK